MEELALKVEHVTKEYRLGTIGGGTLKGELQSKFALWRGKEDPNSKIGSEFHGKNERFIALDDVSFEIKKGEKIGIIGHNGAGKSTILKLICRVTAPSKGNIYLNGRITSMLEVGTGFHGELTGRENIYLNGSILGMSKEEIDEKFDEIVEFSEIGKFIDTPVKRYSSGMTVKLGFSVASHLNSEILIMDEVLAVGDIAFQNKCIKQMRKVADTEGRTILYVSHNMATIRQLCDRCIVLEHGKVRFVGNVEEAIDIYSGDNDISGAVVDCVGLERSQKLLPGAKFNYISIIDKDYWGINVGEKLRINVNLTTSRKLFNVGFRSRLSTLDGSSVSVFLAPKLFSCEPGEQKSFNLEIDTSSIVPGKYCLTPVLYGVNDVGGWCFYDHLDRIITFEVVKAIGFNEDMEWDRTYWGDIKLPQIKVLNDND